MPFSFEMTSDILEIGTPRFVPDFETSTYRKLYNAEPLTASEIAALPKRVELSMHGEAPAAPDFINAAGPTVISERTAEKIKELEPGLHQFVPVDVVWSSSGTSCGTYTYILVTETVEHFEYDRTAWLSKKSGGFGLEAAIDSEYRLAFGFNDPCCLRRQMIEGRHIWRGAPEGTRKIFFCSDEFRNFARATELRGARFIQVGLA